MVSIQEYIIKLSVSLTVLYTFYRIVLYRLTFYQWNRIYLLGYSLLSFVLPFINITPWIEKQGMEGSPLYKIPALGNYALAPTGSGISWTIAEWMLILLVSGIAILSGRMMISYWSLKRIRKQAVLWHADQEVRLFNTGARINPFSFGRSIYVNKKLHSEDELQRIILHEMVHVKQKHTIDLVIGECLSIINWYNPFAWLIRNAIRQNLEFIADKSVLDKGYDKKEYQYLLLKVIGLSQYSMANNFSLPNLKKRIIMMNKMKSATRHLTRFLFALPLLSVVLLAFRNDSKQVRERNPEIISMPLIHTDTIPGKNRVYENVVFFPDTSAVQKPNKNNYILSIADNSGEAVVIIKDNKQKIIKALTIVDWNADKAQNEKKYGRISGVATVALRLTQAVFLKDSPVAQKPIYIVNGITQGPAFDVNSVEPSAIQSITIFKGPEAIKRYGDNAAHGAIIIELKSKDSLKTETIDHRN
ncbi:MAG: M56 family metallopeptidase [Chitinophagales bacterium]